MDPQPQSGFNFQAIVGQLYARPVITVNLFKFNGTPFPEPVDDITQVCESRIQRFKILNQSDVEIAPKSFRTGTAIVPKHGEDPAELFGVFD